MRHSPRPSSRTASDRMRVVRSRDTTAEINVRKALHAKGLRYSVDCAVLHDRRRRADIAFRRLRIAVFVDGCFWHSCPRHSSQPKSNCEWWTKKLAANRRRDADTNRRLRRAGWLVIRIWEHEPPSRAADLIASVVMERRSHLQAARLAGLEESPSFSKRRGTGLSGSTAQ
jgi:DNA mismatch endonuclease, patch repair protein